MAKKDLEKEIVDTTAVTPEETAQVAQEVAEATTDAVAEASTETSEHVSAADALANTVMRSDDDEGKSKQKELSRKEKKRIDKENKERRKKYHVSNFAILKNYRKYSDSEKQHYRYIFGRRVSAKVWPIFRFLILFGLGFVVLYPIMYMISCAFRPQLEMNDPSIMWIPKTFTITNLQDVWTAIDYPNLVLNTMLVNVVCSLLQVVTCSITGYGFARFKFKFKGVLFIIVVLQIIVPTQIILIPQFQQFRYFDIFGIIKAITGDTLTLTDSPIALYMQAFFCNGIRAGLFIFLFRQFFRGLPKELEDAAYLDGCGPIATFIRIMIPNARTSYLTVFIFSLVWYWNDSYVTGMFYNESTNIALEVKNLATTIDRWLNGGTPKGVASDFIVWIEAGCLLSIVPIVIIYCFLQKQFVEGIERSGITGT